MHGISLCNLAGTTDDDRGSERSTIATAYYAPLRHTYSPFYCSTRTEGFDMTLGNAADAPLLSHVSRLRNNLPELISGTYCNERSKGLTATAFSYCVSTMLLVMRSIKRDPKMVLTIYVIFIQFFAFWR